MKRIHDYAVKRAARIYAKIKVSEQEFADKFLSSKLMFSVDYIDELLQDVAIFAPLSHRGMILQHRLKRYRLWLIIVTRTA